MQTREYEYETFEEAMEGLRAAEKDVAADFGEEAVDTAWYDIVHSVAALCAPSVIDEFLRVNGLSDDFEDEI